MSHEVPAIRWATRAETEYLGRVGLLTPAELSAGDYQVTVIARNVRAWRREECGCTVTLMRLLNNEPRICAAGKCRHGAIALVAPLNAAWRSTFSAGDEAYYLHACAWPENAFTQCGDRGIVLNSRETYHTAYFEVFPVDPQTFIRGEGPTILAAETEAFWLWTRVLTCSGHELESRPDGVSGTCRRCGLFVPDLETFYRSRASGGGVR